MKALGVDDDSKGSFMPVYESNLVELLKEHTGPEDVPAFSTRHPEGFALNLKDILGYMDAGMPVYQYRIQWIPQWLANLRGEHLPEPPDGWLSLEEVARIKKISERTIREYCGEKGPLNSLKCKGGVWYVNPDETFDWWITTVPSPGALYYRLYFANALLQMEDFEKPQDLYDAIKKFEDTHPDIKRYGSYENLTIKKFMKRSLGDREPKTIKEWREKVADLIREAQDERDRLYGLV